jgi:hypothetical protein
MLNTSLLNPGVGLALAVEHQNELIADTNRKRLVAKHGVRRSPENTVRATIGTFMVRAGARIAGAGAQPSMAAQAAR